MKRIFTTIAALTVATAMASAQETPLWLRSNSISPDGKEIAFTYKGNIYIVDADGGQARQITTNPAYDTTPIWTPDGQNIVFCSTREKSKDVFMIPAKGGKPVRITTHPHNETPVAVLNDGTILFSAAIEQDTEYGNFPGDAQLYAVSQNGGRPQRVTSLPIKNMSINKDGEIIYEDYKGYEDPFRKHHTSSVTRDIWLYTPEPGQEEFAITGKGTFKKISDFVGEDRNPVFAPDGDTFYYLSEKDGTFNIYRSSISSPEKSEQVTFHKDNPVRYLSISASGDLCYSQDGELYIIRKGKEPQKVEIAMITDEVERPIEYRNLSSGVTRMAVSPNGKELAITVRGDVYVTSADHRTTRRITNTPQQERGLSFSKDGRTIYYAAERNGHWGIWETSLTDKEDKYFTYSVKMEEKQVTPAGETCFQPQVSPDGEWLAYLKNRTGISIMNIKSGKEKDLLPCDVNYSYSDGDQSYEWAPDSRHILCNYQKNGGWNNEDVAVIDIETGEITNLTESGYSDGNFKWALNGKAMTWSSDRGGYRSHGSWGAENDVYIMFFDRKEYTDFTKDKEDRELEDLLKDEKEQKKEKKDSLKEEKKPAKLALDLEDRHDMIVKLTPFAGRLGDHYLTQDGKKLYYMVRLEKSMDLCVMDMEDRSIKVVSKGVYGSLYPTADDKYMYLLSGSGVSRISTATGAKESISFNGDFEYKPA